MPERANTTRLLSRVSYGDERAADVFLPLVYDELHAIAGSLFRHEAPGNTLQPTALVHEAYLRLIDQDLASVTDRTHFLAVAATMVRRAMIDHARARRTEKRGGNRSRVPLVDAPILGLSGVDLIALDDAMVRLRDRDARAERVVELRFFAGLTEAEVARALSVSERTVRNDWAHARAWLRREIGAEAD